MPAPPLRLLVVEDNPLDIRLLQEGFREAGLAPDLLTAMDVDAAWAVLEKGRTKPKSRPEAILLDLNLPGQSGHDLLRRLGTDAEFRALPVVVLTSSNHPDDIERARHGHASAYFLKPLTMAGYLALARDLHQLLVSPARANA